MSPKSLTYNFYLENGRNDIPLHIGSNQSMFIYGTKCVDLSRNRDTVHHPHRIINQCSSRAFTSLFLSTFVVVKSLLGHSPPSTASPCPSSPPRSLSASSSLPPPRSAKRDGSSGAPKPPLQWLLCRGRLGLWDLKRFCGNNQLPSQLRSSEAESTLEDHTFRTRAVGSSGCRGCPRSLDRRSPRRPSAPRGGTWWSSVPSAMDASTGTPPCPSRSICAWRASAHRRPLWRNPQAIAERRKLQFW